MNIFFRGTGKYNRLNLTRFSQGSFIGSREAYYLNWDKIWDKSKAEFPSNTNLKSASYGPSTQWLEQAAFLRLQNLTLGYQIPQKVTKITDIHVSMSCENMFVLTKYKGMDPETVSEINYEDKRDQTFGLDNGSFPMPRVFTFIVRFDF